MEKPTKEQLWNLSGEELKETVEKQESIENAWERFDEDQKNHKVPFISKGYNVSKEEAFESFENIDKESKNIDSEDIDDSFFEHHHLQKEEDPYWKKCVDNIDKNLNKKEL